MTKKSFYKHLSKRVLSFKYAINGLYYAFKTQTNMQIFKTQANMQIHIVAMICVIIAGFYFQVSTTEWLFLMLAIVLVLISEMVNTAIEEIVNFISPTYNTKAGIIKDLAAAFVLLSAIFAIVVGAIVFIPKLLLAFSI